MPSILLITTTDAEAPGRSEKLAKLLRSVADHRREHPDDVRLMLLVQRCVDPAALPDVLEEDWIDLVTIEGRLGLSAARNLLLARARVEGRLNASTVVAYPDDDAWYPPGSLAALAGAFGADTALDFLFCRYGSEPVAADGARPFRPSLQQVIARASSNTILLRGSCAAAVGDFDETLGVGGAVNGGEDTEYALRAFYEARRSGMIDRVLVGHRDPETALKVRYYPGSLRAIARHASRSAAGRLALGRKLAVGVLHVVAGRMPPRDLAQQVAAHVMAGPRWPR